MLCIHIGLVQKAIFVSELQPFPFPDREPKSLPLLPWDSVCQQQLRAFKSIFLPWYKQEGCWRSCYVWKLGNLQTFSINRCNSLASKNSFHKPWLGLHTFQKPFFLLRMNALQIPIQLWKQQLQIFCCCGAISGLWEAVFICNIGGSKETVTHEIVIRSLQISFPFLVYISLLHTWRFAFQSHIES